MSVRRVLYASQIDHELQAQLRIVTFKKANSRGKKNKVFFVEFASQADAEAAARKCRRLGNMTLKEYQPLATETSTEPRLKVRHVSSQLAPNSTVVRSLVDSLQSCLAVMETVRKSADRIRVLNSEYLRQ
jgi:hypothetical protein